MRPSTCITATSIRRRSTDGFRGAVESVLCGPYRTTMLNRMGRGVAVWCVARLCTSVPVACATNGAGTRTAPPMISMVVKRLTVRTACPWFAIAGAGWHASPGCITLAVRRGSSSGCPAGPSRWPGAVTRSMPGESGSGENWAEVPVNHSMAAALIARSTSWILARMGDFQSWWSRIRSKASASWSGRNCENSRNALLSDVANRSIPCGVVTAVMREGHDRVGMLPTRTGGNHSSLEGFFG